MPATDRPQTEDQVETMRRTLRESARWDVRAPGGKHGADEQTRAGTPMTLPRNETLALLRLIQPDE